MKPVSFNNLRNTCKTGVMVIILSQIHDVRFYIGSYHFRRGRMLSVAKKNGPVVQWIE